MTMQDLKHYTPEELDRLEFEMLSRGNLVAANSIGNFKKFYSKRVKIFKGRKVPMPELKIKKGMCTGQISKILK